MKNRLSVVLALVTVGLAVICFYQSRRLTERRTQAALLRTETEQQAQELDELKASKEHLNRQRSELLRQATDQAVELRKERPAQAESGSKVAGGASSDPAKPDNDPAGFGKFLSKMMEDPDTKKMIQEQQRMMMDSLYAPLLKQMGLTPEESDKFKEMLAATAMKGAEKATSLFGNAGTNRSDVLNTLVAENKASEERMKELLGDARYAQYQQYQQTAGERMQLNLFKQQAGAGESALSDAQTEQILGFMREEKQVLAAAGQPLPGTGNDPATLQAIQSEDQSEVLLQGQDNVNQRVYERAKEVLSPEQLTAFGKFQTNQMQMMRMGLTMARKFMPADKPLAPR
jgi:hypothetical protein